MGLFDLLRPLVFILWNYGEGDQYRYCKNNMTENMTLKATLVKIPATVFTELENTILKFLRKKNKENIPPPNTQKTEHPKQP